MVKRLSDNRRRRLSNVGQILAKKNVGKVFVALDEAQHDLDATFCGEISPVPSKSESRYWGEDKTMIQVFNLIQYPFQKLLSDMTIQHQIGIHKIYSGTSLRLDEMIAYLKRRLPGEFRYNLHSDFPLLRSKEQFKCLLDKIKDNIKSRFGQNLRELIERYSGRLRGRYLWGTLYIDHLNSLKDQKGILDEAAIQQAASDVASRAKGDLKERLTR